MTYRQTLIQRVINKRLAPAGLTAETAPMDILAAIVTETNPLSDSSLNVALECPVGMYYDGLRNRYGVVNGYEENEYGDCIGVRFDYAPTIKHERVELVVQAEGLTPATLAEATKAFMAEMVESMCGGAK